MAATTDWHAVWLIAWLCLIGCSRHPTPVEPKVICRSPNSDKTTPVFEYKFTAMKEVLAKVIPANDHGVELKGLDGMVGKTLTDSQKTSLGNYNWLAETVRKELQVRGQIERVPKSKPLRVRWVKTKDR